MIPGQLECSSLACSTAMATHSFFFPSNLGKGMRSNPKAIPASGASAFFPEKEDLAEGRQWGKTAYYRARESLSRPAYIPSPRPKPTLGTKSVLANPLIGWGEGGGERGGTSFYPGLKSQKLTPGRTSPACPQVASTSHRPPSTHSQHADCHLELYSSVWSCQGRLGPCSPTPAFLSAWVSHS